MALLEGLEQLPEKIVEYKGISLKELDLDAALQRRPNILLVDELAHSNAAGCRHSKRYQDVEELLRAGISVYTTVNVQHLESLNDRWPPSLILPSASVSLIRFLTPPTSRISGYRADDLILRLQSGKVYQKQQASRALNHSSQGIIWRPFVKLRCAAPLTN